MVLIRWSVDVCLDQTTEERKVEVHSLSPIPFPSSIWPQYRYEEVLPSFASAFGRSLPLLCLSRVV